MTSQRRRFTNADLQIGVEYGIEWSTPKGSCHILANAEKIEVDFLGIAYGDFKGIKKFDSLKEFNRFLATEQEE